MGNPVLICDPEVIVIPDECGDTLWDAVLQQEMNAGDEKVISNSTEDILKKIEKRLVPARTRG